MTDAREQGLLLLRDIAQAAHNTDRLCFHVEDQRDELNELLVGHMRATINKLGWMAETVLERLGEGQLAEWKGSADKWLLSPVCRSVEVSHG